MKDAIGKQRTERINFLLPFFQERDQLVRKGILTPFSNLKGFERRFQQSETSSSYNASQEEKTDDITSSSVERAARSISEAARARPTTKLLESEDLPKLEAPTRPFVRLRGPLKLSQSQEREVEKKKNSKRQKRRPLPGRKWTKHVSSEDIHLGETGMFIFSLHKMFEFLLIRTRERMGKGGYNSKFRGMSKVAALMLYLNCEE